MSKPPTRQDEAGRLYYSDGLSYAEVATEMGISTEGVKTHLRWFRINHGISNRREAVEWFRQTEGANA